MANPEDFGAVAAAPRPEDFGAVAHDSTTMDVVKSTGQGLVDGLLGITSALKDGFKLANFPVIGPIYDNSLYDLIVGKQQKPEDAAALEKTYRDAHHFQQTTVEKNLANLHAPQTTPGQYARAGAGGATMGLLTAGPAGIVPGFTSGLGAQAGGDIGEQLGYPKTGAVVGSVLGAVAPAGATAGFDAATKPFFGNNAASVARQGMEGMTDADFAAAQAMQQKAAGVGIPLTGAESTGNPQLLGMQRTLEQQPGSAPIMQNALKDRPQQVNTAVDTAMNPLGPRSADPALVGNDVQTASDNALKTAEQARTNSTAQAYALAEKTKVDPAAIKNLIASMERAAANDKTGTLSAQVDKAKQLLVESPGKPAVPMKRVEDPKSGVYKVTPGTPAEQPTYITDIDNLDRAKKAIRDMAEIPPFGAEAGAKETSKYLKNFAAHLDGIMKTSKPYAAAVDDFKAASPPVDAKIAGTIGAMTKTADPVSQWTRLVDPQLSRSGTVTVAAQDLIKQNPEAYRKLVRLGIENEVNAALKVTNNPANSVGGAAIAKGWFSTPQRLANVREAVSNLPNGGVAVDALDNVMSVLRQTGLRQTTGSPTASNAANVEALGPTGGALTGFGVHPVKGVGEALETMFTKRSATQLAKILTDPDSVELLRKIANYDPAAPYTKAGIIGILNATGQEKSK